MSETSLYVTLPSDASMSQYPRNEGGAYTVQLPETLHLNTEWEVGLAELIFNQDWPAVNHNDIWIRCDTPTRAEQINTDMNDTTPWKDIGFPLYFKSESWSTFWIEAIPRESITTLNENHVSAEVRFDETVFSSPMGSIEFMNTIREHTKGVLIGLEPFHYNETISRYIDEIFSTKNVIVDERSIKTLPIFKISSALGLLFKMLKIPVSSKKIDTQTILFCTDGVSIDALNPNYVHSLPSVLYSSLEPASSYNVGKPAYMKDTYNLRTFVSNPEEFVKTVLNDLAEEAFGDSFTAFRYEKTVVDTTNADKTSHFRLFFKSTLAQGWRLEFSPALLRIMGFSSSQVVNRRFFVHKSIKKETETSTPTSFLEFSFDRGMSPLWIYSDVIIPHMVGNTHAPLLRIIGIEKGNKRRNINRVVT
ncbi:MAG: hypothetical protein HKP06_08105, partial [Flavobacteriaceae bacterium]|nr:hypothetical protein [Flavobacteriaceae bacterium]